MPRDTYNDKGDTILVFNNPLYGRDKRDRRQADRQANTQEGM
jgi:hypothetical protein